MFILRCMVLVLISLIITVILFPTMIMVINGKSCSVKANRMYCCANLKQIGLSLQQYAEAYEGYYPNKNGAAGLEQLRIRDYFIYDYKKFRCSKGPVPAPLDEIVRKELPMNEKYVQYVYRSGYTKKSGKDIPVVWDKLGNHNTEKSRGEIFGGEIKKEKLKINKSSAE